MIEFIYLPDDLQIFMHISKYRGGSYLNEEASNRQNKRMISSIYIPKKFGVNFIFHDCMHYGQTSHLGAQKCSQQQSGN